jgi:organic hydroperoxide reductase OsmC/OhrA
MVRTTTASRASFSTETVWNSGLAGTGATSEGLTLSVGREGDWAPEHLILLATESCFMSTFLSLAAGVGIDVLGYVSSGRLQATGEPRARPAVILAPCAVVASSDDAARLADVARRAQRESVAAHLLGPRLKVEMDVRIVPQVSA